MERSSTDPASENHGGWRGDAPEHSVAVVEPIASMSGAHWANRDSHTQYRRPDRTGPFRRPPAENSFPDDGQEPAASPSAPQPARQPATSGVANADLFGPDPDVDPHPGFGPHSDLGPQPDSGPHPDFGPQSDFGPDPDRFGGNGEDAEESTAVRASRHWTTLGTGTRRPRTSDRGEVSAPGGGRPRPAGSAAVPVTGQMPASKASGPGKTAGSKAVGLVKAVRARAGGPTPDDDDTIGVLVGPGREIRPHRATRQSGATRQAANARQPGAALPSGSGGRDNTGHGTATADRPRRSRRVVWASLTMVFVVLVGGAGAALVSSGRAGALTAMLGGGSDDQRTVTAPLAGRTEASFELVTGTTRVALRTEDLGADLYRITTASDSGTVPRPVVDEDRVQLHLTPDGDGATGEVEIVLAAKVSWALRFTGGADEQRIDLSRGRVSGIDVVGGVRRFEVSLPKPAGTVGIRIAGAVDEFLVQAPADIPVRARLTSGAKTVAAGERIQRDVPPGSTFTPRNWQVPDRYDVAAGARVTLFSMKTAG